MRAKLDSARGLLVYGLIWAVLAAGVGAALAPSGFNVTTSRKTEMEASLRALNAGAPPLLSRVKGHYYPSGATDDQGIYVFGPVLAKIIGISDGAKALKWLWLICFFVPIAFYPLLFRRLFGSLEAALIAPFALTLLIASLGVVDIYWIQAWAIVALFPLILYARELRPRWTLPLLAGVALAASFATSIRSQAGVPAVIAALAVVALFRDWRPLRRVGAGVLVIVCYLAVSPLGLSALRAYRDHWVHQPHFAQDVPSGHPFWHNTYIGLGYLPNRWKIKWSDSVAANSVQRVRPGTQYVSKPYENTLRHLYFNVWKDDAGYVVGETFQKLLVLFRHALIYLAFVLLTLPWMLTAAARRQRFRVWALLLLPAVLITVIPPLITVPYRTYELGFYGAIGMLALLVIGEWAAPTWTVVRGLPEALRAAIADGRARLRLPGARVAAVVSAVLLMALAATFVVGGTIQNRATAWIQQPIVQGPLP